MKEEIKNKILNQIMEDKVKMKPKYRFWFDTLAIGFLTFFFMFLTFYIFSFIAFLFIDLGIINAPRFGLIGLYESVRSLPIFLILAGLVFIFITLKLAKHFKFVYKKKVLNSFVYILIFIFLSQILLITTGAMNTIKEEAFKRKIPLAPQMLHEMRDISNPQIIIGRVMATDSGTITIINKRGHILEIPIATITNKNIYENNFKINDLVQILLNQPLNTKNVSRQKNVFLEDILILE